MRLRPVGLASHSFHTSVDCALRLLGSEKGKRLIRRVCRVGRSAHSRCAIEVRSLFVVFGLEGFRPALFQYRGTAVVCRLCSSHLISHLTTGIFFRCRRCRCRRRCLLLLLFLLLLLVLSLLLADLLANRSFDAKFLLQLLIQIAVRHPNQPLNAAAKRHSCARQVNNAAAAMRHWRLCLRCSRCVLVLIGRALSFLNHHLDFLLWLRRWRCRCQLHSDAGSLPLLRLLTLPDRLCVRPCRCWLPREDVRASTAHLLRRHGQGSA